MATTRIGFWTSIWSTGVGSGLLISMLGKLNWFLLAGLTTLLLLMWKWMVVLLRKNHLLRCWGWISLLNWIGAPFTISIAKNATKKLKPYWWLVLWSFFLLRLLSISVNVPYGHTWNALVMSWLVLLAAAGNC